MNKKAQVIVNRRSAWKPVERLREIWTPTKDVQELFRDLSPGSELDSMLRHFLHAILQQKGPQTLDLAQPNTGWLRWEIVDFTPNPRDPSIARKQISLWVDQESES